MKKYKEIREKKKNHGDRSIIRVAKHQGGAVPLGDEATELLLALIDGPLVLPASTMERDRRHTGDLNSYDHSKLQYFKENKSI